MKDSRTEEGTSAAPMSSWCIAVWVQLTSPSPGVFFGCSEWDEYPFLHRSWLEMPVFSRDFQKASGMSQNKATRQGMQG